MLDEDRRILDKQLKALWKIFYTGAQTSVEKKLPLHIKT